MGSQRTEFEKALDILVATFKKYADSDKSGKADQLEKSEMNDLVKKELITYFKEVEMTPEQAFNQVDSDQSGSVDFTEFMMLIAKIVMETNIYNLLKQESQNKYNSA